ncbi:CAP domain-containing protein [Paenibacillus sacheonensis]|uniref:LysM peptidoglycan-binding domain-containing protein n=1 Tax=Paenibacillus sacheonensis TaxID=742054 RepID=A0A7X5BYV4_9BACL|nr:CAP domain-containing protein [Paenibacillus sacheonensis]MBM7567392.1 putative YkwD family protein [Paenibacillus sacheonensis]NBC69826.1 LysM peptidoglycan-binding domain-containing protein [Paenibacillus sacheonensis]
MKMQPFRTGVASVLAAGLIVLGGGAALQKAEAASVNPSVTYQVTNNDTMYKIAQKYGVSLGALIAANPVIANPNVIWAGMTVKVPTAGSGGSASTGGTTSNTGTSTTDKTTFAAQVVTLVNKERANAGLTALKSDSLLTKVALDKAKDMYANNYFDHNSPTYGSPFDMMRAYGVAYSYAGENIAKGQRTPQEVMTAWMNSAGHKANILGSHYGKIGVAYYNGEWVQEFTS